MNFTKEDILDALGIETQGSWFIHALAGFGVGCVVGAAVAVLVAPKSGRELREDIVERGRDIVQRRKEQFASKREGTGQAPVPPVPTTY